MTATENSRAAAIANSEKTRSGAGRDLMGQLFLNRMINGGGRRSKEGSGKSAVDWENDVRAHELKSDITHYYGQQAADAAAKRDVDVHQQKLDTVLGGVDTIKEKHGGIPLNIKHGSTAINFGAQHPGYGSGNQGKGKQQTARTTRATTAKPATTATVKPAGTRTRRTAASTTSSGIGYDLNTPV